MIIRTLVENTSENRELGYEHGLSLYIETKKHKLLFDVGASDLFIKNAERMGIDLREVDLVVISHGHYDHGGGLEAFLKINSRAKIYINSHAFEGHYALRGNGERVYIGLNSGLLPDDRFVFTEDFFQIDEELELFSKLKDKKVTTIGDRNLLLKKGNKFVHDVFDHEQNLMIKQGEQLVLVTGCAHNGIINIIDHVIEVEKREPDYVIGGFHLFRTEIPLVSKVGEYLLNTKSKFYTGHCTGLEQYTHLKIMMGAKINYLSAGSKIEL